MKTITMEKTTQKQAAVDKTKASKSRQRKNASRAFAEKKIQSTKKFAQQPQPHTPAQDLEVFGRWVAKPIWVPPNKNSKEMAKSMLNKFGPFATKEKCWSAISRQHRDKFTQVREFELPKASIRLPQGKLFVTVTEQKDFDLIEEDIPACVQTRLDEFLSGPGKKRGVKVYYLKPLCVEIGDDLIFTTAEELDASIAKIQDEVFNEYRKRYLPHLIRQIAVGTLHASLAVPRALISLVFNRKKREIGAYHAKLEFERRRRAMEAVQFHNGYRSDKCTFEEVIGLTNAPKREDVIEQYVEDQELSSMNRKMFLLASAEALPWFAALSLLSYQIATAYVAASVSVAVCDPAFVAEMPGSNGKLLKIGHFDEVGGVMHVEI